MSHSSKFSLAFLVLFLIQTFPFIAQAVVPASATFKFVNQGDFGEFIVEYDASYRVLSIANSPFQLAWYNTTPNAYYLALRVGTVRSESLMRWVWDFNRGNPVRENATFSLGTNGNLVVADSDGRIAWQSGTANKGVTGFELLPNGNMVLHDKSGKFIWQSFDFPTDTLLVEQSLRVKGANKLVSRASPEKNVNGPYSLVLEPRKFALYFKSKNSPSPQLYFDSTDWLSLADGSLDSLKLNVDSDNEDRIYEINLIITMVNTSNGGGSLFLGRTRYDSNITYVRLGIDGSLKAFTYDRDVDITAWEVTFDLFPSTAIGPGVCQLPEKCGNFGLCDVDQCVACPSPKGLLGWSKKCTPNRISSCAVKDVKYYKLVGVDHFITKYTKGDAIKESDCAKKCTSDCKCSGYFYHTKNSTCWTASDLMTLTKGDDKTHLAYIKI